MIIVLAALTGRRGQLAEAKRIIVATPVAGESIAGEIHKIVEGIVILEIPEYFYAVAVYRNWHDVADQEVLKIVEG